MEEVSTGKVTVGQRMRVVKTKQAWFRIPEVGQRSEPGVKDKCRVQTRRQKLGWNPMIRGI